MKRVARSLVVVIILVFAMSTVAYACDLAAQVERSNTRIEHIVANAQMRASLPHQNVDRIIDQMVRQIDNIVERLDRLAQREGVTLEHEYYTVEVGGQTVTIDPCRVPGV